MLRDDLRPAIARLAERGVYVGTSSWKYPGWQGQIYDEQRYVWRGKWARTRFDRDCLAEYAQTFKTVCVDGAYYQFPSAHYLEGMASQVPDDFRFTFKVTEEITVKRFPNLDRHGDRAGQLNPNLLNFDHFLTAFLQPWQGIWDELSDVASGRSIDAGHTCRKAGIEPISPSSANLNVSAVGRCVSRTRSMDTFQGRLPAEFATNTLRVLMNAWNGPITGELPAASRPCHPPAEEP